MRKTLSLVLALAVCMLCVGCAPNNEYTLEPGHTLSLVLTTWDPYRAFLDEDYKVNSGRDAQYSFYTYGYTIHNDTLEVRIPFR